MSRAMVGVAGLVGLVSAQNTPGFQFLGFGYDALYGNPKSTEGDGDPGFRTNIFTFTNNDKQMTQDGKWQVPDKTTSQDFGETCTETQDSKIMASAYDYQNTVEDGIGLSGGFMGVEFSLSTDMKKVDHQTRNKTSIFAQVQAKCSAYRLTMHTYDHPPLDPNFVAGVKYLPNDYSEAEYMQFLKNFGTHAVTQLQVGGRWGWQMTFNYQSYVNMLDDSVDVSFGISVAAQAKAGFNVSHKEDKKSYMHVVNSISSNATFNVGGSFSPDTKTWMDSVKAAPMPVYLDLTSLATLISPMYIPDVDAAVLEKKSKSMKQAVSGYCAYVKKTIDSTATCTKPEPRPAPQPDPVVENAVRRICVLNDGAYMMNWLLNDLTTQYPVPTSTANYAHGQTNCLDGLQIGADRGDKLNCRVNRIASKSEDCQVSSIVYDARATKQANFVCRGSTYTGTCDFAGLSNYGVKVEAPAALDVLV